MSRDSELESLIRVQIEEPAGREIMDLIQRGVIQESDRQRFSISAERYKQAVFAEYDTFDPAVRRELLMSLVSSYKETIDRLLSEIRNRALDLERLDGRMRKSPSLDPGSQESSKERDDAERSRAPQDPVNPVQEVDQPDLGTASDKPKSGSWLSNLLWGNSR